MLVEMAANLLLSKVSLTFAGVFQNKFCRKTDSSSYLWSILQEALLETLRGDKRGLSKTFDMIPQKLVLQAQEMFFEDR